MLAGGTGITPMYQVANMILKNPNDKTKMRLIFANLTEEDILLQKELAALAVEHPDRCVACGVGAPRPTGSAAHGTRAA